MKQNLIASLLLAAFALLVVASDVRAADDDGLKAVDEAWVKAIKAGDADAVAACYAEDAILWAPNHDVVKGKDAIRALFKDIFENSTIVDITETDMKYQTVGEKSVAWGTFKMTLKPKGGGEEKTMTGRFTEIGEKRDGKWVYIVDHASADPQ